VTLAPIQLGSLRLATNLLLAPIAGYCDLSFRLIARGCGGVGLACTDLLSPEGVLRENYHSMQLAQTDEGDSPLAMQLYGADVNLLCQAARWAEDHGANVVDINMGCPVDKITKLDGGSKLLCHPEQTVRMVEKIRAAVTKIPLTAKLRLGWDDASIVAPSLARKLENAGVDMITIHGRTTAMRFGGHVRLDGIAAVAAAVQKIPVIGNGDIHSPADALRMLQTTGCAGVMIGRGALSNPWIFRDTWSYLTTAVIPPPPTLEQRVQLMCDHFARHAHYRGEWSAVCEFRTRVSWYAKQLHPCKMLKQEMRKINTANEFAAVVRRFLDWRMNQCRLPIADCQLPIAKPQLSMAGISAFHRQSAIANRQ